MSNSIVAKTEAISDNPFDSIRHLDDQSNEFWYARDLMPLLGYLKWDRFTGVIEKAKLSFYSNPVGCIADHVISFYVTVKRNQGGGTDLLDFKLSRYLCYLVAMNGDIRKPEIAAAQSYFAVKLMFADRVIHYLTGNTTSPFPFQSESFVKDKSGFIYLVKAGHNNTYKIGYSKNVYKRLEQLQTSCPFDLTVIHRVFSTNACLLESKLHDYYSAYWMRGEWFELTMELVNSFLSVANELDGQIEVESNQVEASQVSV